MPQAIEQYKILWGNLNHELQRFWIRVNTLLGFQIAIIAGLANFIRNENQELFIFGFILLLAFSYSTFLMIRRTRSIYNLIYESIIEFESKNNEFYLTDLDVVNKELVKNPKTFDYIEWIVSIILFGSLFFFIYFIGVSFGQSYKEYPIKNRILDELEKFDKEKNLFKGIQTIQIGASLNANSITTELNIDVPLNFKLKEYRLPATFIASKNYSKIGDLGDEIRETNENRLRRTFSKTVNNSEIKLNNDEIDLKYLIDFDGIIDLTRLLKSKFKRLKTTIYIKGFADGSIHENWEDSLELSHFYSSIEYYKKDLSRPGTDFDYFYQDTVSYQVIENGKYGNKHLPNLRAKYIVEELIRPQLMLSGINESIDIKILEGKEINRVNRKSELRFSKIYLEFNW